MIMKTINPDSGVYAATSDYVHGLELSGAGRLLFVSGTMGLDHQGTPPDSLEEQLDLVWDNLRAILSAAQMTTENIVRVTSYLTDAAFAEENQNARVQALGERRVPTTSIVAKTLKPDWLIEVEIVAAA